MSVRQFFVCLFLGPVFMALGIVWASAFPLVLGVGYLMAAPNLWRSACEISFTPYAAMFMGAYRGMRS